MKKKYSMFILIIILIICSAVAYANRDRTIETDYYNTIFIETEKVYAEVSGMLMIENQVELDTLRANVMESDIQISNLKKNRATKAGEERVNKLILYAYRSISMKQEKIDNLDMKNSEEIYDNVTLIAEEYKAISRIISKRGIELKAYQE